MKDLTTWLAVLVNPPCCIPRSPNQPARTKNMSAQGVQRDSTLYSVLGLEIKVHTALLVLCAAQS